MQTIDSSEQPLPPQFKEEVNPKELKDQVINIKEIQKKKRQKDLGPQMPRSEGEPITRWLIVAGSLSLPLVGLSLLVTEILYLIPLTLIVCLVIWYFRDKEKRNSWERMQIK